ncbi:hypothetical protein [Endozoicomonas sp. 8E]|uniref:hypothetical protein n=1 Tax=Endozoicomonas sp. 8E TaxID=3035692 RepID=UPI0029390249|nr:hypothetical protein [Endozoicomonas sp. 8E]WOG26995.1 hypothetical protein P6910_20955 [Endozoicomonas sp. 8E]
MPVISQAEPLTKRFVVELQQDPGSPNQVFSIKPVRRKLAGKPSDIVGIKGYSGPFLPYERRLRPYSYRIKTFLIESISWQWYYATNLLVTYELILTTKDTPLSPDLYSWLPLETVVAVGWLLKSYWNPYSPLFKPIELQSAFILALGEHPFSVTTMMPGSGDEQQKGQPSGCFDQQTPVTTTHPISYLTRLQYSDSGDGDKAPRQHTLDLNCFAYSCNGVCRFRSAPNSRGATEWPLNSEESATGFTGAAAGPGPHYNLTEGDCSRWINDFDTLNATDSRQNPLFETLNGLPDIQHRCDSVQPFQTQTHLHDKARMPGNESATTDDLIIINGLLNLRNQRFFKVTRQTTTGIRHVSRHSGKLTCVATVIREDGLQTPCGIAFKNTQSLSSHKSRVHTGQKTCNKKLVGEDGRQRLCGSLYKNAGALSNHKIRDHTEQKTCDATVVGEDGQPQACGMLCKNARAMSDHKSKYHTGQKTCDAIMVKEDGRQRACRKVFKNSNLLTYHKRQAHSGKQTCDETQIGDDGVPRPCRMVCKNANALSNHKRVHRKRKPVDEDQD